MSVIERPSTRVHLHARQVLANRVRKRLPELEASVAARVYGIMDPRETKEPAYLEGLRGSLRAALDWALTAFERGEERAPAIPPALLAQARMAARNHVTLDTVLRRYFAGYSILSDYLIQEINRGSPPAVTDDFQLLLEGQGTIFDRLIKAISEEYSRELTVVPGSREQQRAGRLKQLLLGEHIDVSGFPYDFDGHHVGVIVVGDEALLPLRESARQLNQTLLTARIDGEVRWAWLGGQQGVEPRHLRETFRRWRGRSSVKLAIGEPSKGLHGWRLTHRQAMAALPFTDGRSGGIAHYRDVALIASMRMDNLLTMSLQQIFLSPLEEERDGGEASRATLRAYFAAERNVTSAAAALGVKRHTVTNRLRSIEAALGIQLPRYLSELEAALALEEMEGSAGSRPDRAGN